MNYLPRNTSTNNRLLQQTIFLFYSRNKFSKYILTLKLYDSWIDCPLIEPVEYKKKKNLEEQRLMFFRWNYTKQKFAIQIKWFVQFINYCSYFYIFIALYNWRGDTRYGLPLEIGETVQILEECAGQYNWPWRYNIKKTRALKSRNWLTLLIIPLLLGWFRGFTTKNRAVKGIFPASYVQLKPCKIDNEGLFESVIPLEDPVVREVTLVLREWGGIWKRLYVVSAQQSPSMKQNATNNFFFYRTSCFFFQEREVYKFDTLRKVMRELLEWRRQLLGGTLTSDQTRELKLKIINKVDWGNRWVQSFCS